jgi:hypothetical protein
MACCVSSRNAPARMRGRHINAVGEVFPDVYLLQFKRLAWKSVGDLQGTVITENCYLFLSLVKLG